MYTAFIRPARRELGVGFLLIALALGLGRFLAGDGGAWSWLAGWATLLMFYVAAVKWPAVRQLDVPRTTWLRGAVATLAPWAVVLAVVATAAAVVMQLGSPYYMGYDLFLQTTGPVEHLDTNGLPYIVDDAGVTAGTVGATFLNLLLFYATFALVGLAAGLTHTRWGLTLLGLGVLHLVTVYVIHMITLIPPAVLLVFAAAPHITLLSLLPLWAAAAWLIHRTTVTRPH